MASAQRIPLNLDFAGYRIRRGALQWPLTRTEREVLHVLVHAPGQPVSRDHILRSVWGDEAAIESANVDNVISRLRRKLQEVGASPRLIRTVRGRGYSWIAVRDDADSSQQGQANVTSVKGIRVAAAL